MFLTSVSSDSATELNEGPISQQIKKGIRVFVSNHEIRIIFSSIGSGFGDQTTQIRMMHTLIDFYNARQITLILADVSLQHNTDEVERELKRIKFLIPEIEEQNPDQEFTPYKITIKQAEITIFTLDDIFQCKKNDNFTHSEDIELVVRRKDPIKNKIPLGISGNLRLKNELFNLDQLLLVCNIEMLLMLQPYFWEINRNFLVTDKKTKILITDNGDYVNQEMTYKSTRPIFLEEDTALLHKRTQFINFHPKQNDFKNFQRKNPKNATIIEQILNLEKQAMINLSACYFSSIIISNAPLVFLNFIIILAMRQINKINTKPILLLMPLFLERIYGNGYDSMMKEEEINKYFEKAKGFKTLSKKDESESLKFLTTVFSLHSTRVIEESWAKFANRYYEKILFFLKQQILPNCTIVFYDIRFDENPKNFTREIQKIQEPLEMPIVIIASVEKIDPPIFNYIITKTNSVNLVEGANSFNLCLNAKKPTIRILSSEWSTLGLKELRNPYYCFPDIPFSKSNSPIAQKIHRNCVSISELEKLDKNGSRSIIWEADNVEIIFKEFANFWFSPKVQKSFIKSGEYLSKLKNSKMTVALEKFIMPKLKKKFDNILKNTYYGQDDLKDTLRKIQTQSKTAYNIQTRTDQDNNEYNFSAPYQYQNRIIIIFFIKNYDPEVFDPFYHLICLYYHQEEDEEEKEIKATFLGEKPDSSILAYAIHLFLNRFKKNYSKPLDPSALVDPLALIDTLEFDLSQEMQEAGGTEVSFKITLTEEEEENEEGEVG